MKRRALTAAFAVCLLTAGAQQEQGSNSWTLDDCIRYASEHNLTVQQNLLTQKQRTIELNTARNSILPTVQASGSQNFSIGRGLSEDNTYVSSNTANTSFGLGANLDLFTGLKVKNSIALGRLNLAAANADYANTKEEVRISVMEAYVQVLYNMEIADVAQLQVNIDSMQVERLSALKAAGRASAAEVATQRSTLAKSRLTLTQSRNSLKLSLLELTQLLELQSPENFSIVPPDLTEFDLQTLPDPEQVYSNAVNERPSVKAEMLRTDYAKTNVSLSKSAYYPTLSMNFGIGTNYYAVSGASTKSFAEQMRTNFSPYVGLSLNVPVFDKLATRNSVRTAKIQAESQQIQLETEKKSLYKKIQQAYYEAVAAQDKYSSSKAAVESSQESFDLTKAKYEEGRATPTEFNEAKNNLMQSKSEEAQAQYQCLYQRKLLEIYGSPALD